MHLNGLKENNIDQMKSNNMRFCIPGEFRVTDLGVAIFFLFILSLCPFSNANALVNQSNQIIQTSKQDKGELKIIEGIPFLKLSGTYYEMGEQYGRLLKEDMQKIYTHLIPYKDKWLQELPDDICERLERLTPEEMIQQLKGMADGSGLPYNDLLLSAYWGVLERGGCSSILVKIKRGRKDERILHGRNYDYGYEMGKFPVVVEYQPKGGIKHVVPGTIGYVAAPHGVNDYGITVSENMGRGDRRENTIHYMSPNLKLREILYTATNLHQADELSEEYKSDVGVIHTISSASENDGAIYDIYYNAVKRNGFNGNDYLFATTSYLNEELNRQIKCPRYKIIDGYVQKRMINSVDDMIKVLADPGSTYGVNNSSTIHSIVFDPQQKTIYMAFNEKFAAWGKWLKYDWKEDKVTVYKEANRNELEKSDKVELTGVHVIGAYWQGDPAIPPGPVLKNLHFVLQIKEWFKEKNVQQLYDFSARATKELTLRSEGHPDITATLTKGTISTPDFHGFWFEVNDTDLDKMIPNITYRIHLENISAIYRWIIEDDVFLIRLEEK